MIFCQTKSLVVELTQTLKSHGYAADCLHGDMEQPARERAMKAFKSKQVTIMVCTDVAARGIDVKDLTHVINYSLPRELDNYVHRIGRTGRAGKEGVVWNLVSPSHMGLISRTERAAQAKMIRGQVPDESTILKLKVGRALTDFNKPLDAKVVNGAAIIKGLLLETGWKEVIELMSKEEIAARFLAKALKVDAPVKKAEEPMGARRDFENSRGSGRAGSRDGRRREFVDRNMNTRTRKPDFSTFSPPAGGGRAEGGFSGGARVAGGFTSSGASESFAGLKAAGPREPKPRAYGAGYARTATVDRATTRPSPWKRK